MSFRPQIIALVVCLIGASALAEEADYFPAVAKLIEDRCLDCHAADDPDGKLVMERYEDILKGGESGAVVKAGKGGESLLVHYLRGEVEKDGKKKFMPPGKREKLTGEEIEMFVKWIDAGAKPPQRAMGKKIVEVPKVAPKGTPRVPVNALAFSPQAKLVAAAHGSVVELVEPVSQAVVKRLEGHRGAVNALVWSADGAMLFAASGENAIEGEVRQWNVAEAKVARTFKGHRDMIFALALSADGKTLATGSYDQKIKLWNVADGAERKILSGHNGAVYGLAFRPDGKLLASASADRTVKLWDVASGERRDTLSQPGKEQFAVAWSADGKRLAAAGADNRIRVWSVSPDAKETTNPLVVARFAHEQPILRLVWSADGAAMLSSAQDGTVRVWDAAEVKERVLLEKQPDWPTALAFSGETVVTGRADGTVAFYDTKTGKRIAAPGGACRSARASGGLQAQVSTRSSNARGATRFTALGDHSLRAEKIFCQAKKKAMEKPAPPPKGPFVSGVLPRGIERGRMIEMKLTGGNLPAFVSVKCEDARVRVFTGTVEKDAVSLVISTPVNLPRGGYAIVASGADGKEIGRATLRVEDIVVIEVPAGTTMQKLTTLPVNVWGTIAKAGESDRYEFEAKAGATLIFDCQAKALGSKADAVLTLMDAAGRVLATDNQFDGSGDPFIAHKFAADGRYAIVVGDATMTGSADHFFSLTIGALPFVASVFPLCVPANAETKVELVGYNLPADAAARMVVVKAGASGTAPVKLDAQKFRSRAPAALAVSEVPNFIAAVGCDTVKGAQKLDVPFSVNGRFLKEATAEHFRFTAKKGVTYAVETEASRRGSPVDTKVAVLWPDGRPVERLLLQAVRDSAITFRPIDSANSDARVDNWREMELNELMWMQGEVTKIFRMPEGPDSGCAFYANAGKRIAYFDTSATAHSLDEPCYIVEPHPPGTKLVANGLPIFTLHYENDDDGSRNAGSDSRLLFTAPEDGDYVVRVRDSRGRAGERFIYRLIVREARPDFAVKFSEAAAAVNVGSGAAFTLTAERKDGFDGDIICEITGVPAGWHVTSPLVIQAGHLQAKGSISALPGAGKWTPAKISATAEIDGKKIVHPAGEIAGVKAEGEAPMVVSLQPAGADHSAPTFQRDDGAVTRDIKIAPGETISAWVVLKRGSAKGALRFDVENLPHGVVVDNLGLNGITLLEGQDVGEIFLKAASWVPETDRLAVVVCREAGKQASLPVLLHVRRKGLAAEVNEKP
jgi:WD40 repeat protein